MAVTATVVVTVVTETITIDAAASLAGRGAAKPAGPKQLRLAVDKIVSHCPHFRFTLFILDT